MALALYLKAHNARPEQVQDFYPTPGTISTCMYHTGIDPITMKDVYVRPTRTKRRCSARFCSIPIPKTPGSCAKRSPLPDARI